MFCAKCGSELGSGVKFCAKCGTPVNVPVAEIEPTPVMGTFMREPSHAPSSTPIMPEVPQINTNKKPVVMIAVAIAMICVLIFGFFTLRGVKGEWEIKEVYNNGEKIELNGRTFKLNIESDKLIGNDGNETREMKIILEDGFIKQYDAFEEAYINYAKIGWSGFDIKLYNADNSNIYEIYSRVWTGVFLMKMIACVLVFIMLAAYFVVYLKKQRGYAGEGTYSGVTTSLPLVGREPVLDSYATPVEPTPIVPDYVEPAPEAPEYVAPVEPEITMPENVSTMEPEEFHLPDKTVEYVPTPSTESDLDVYNTVDEFEAMSSSSGTAPSPARVEYPTDHSPEEKKSAGNEWFSTAGDL